MTGTRGATPHVSDVVAVMQELGKPDLERRRTMPRGVPGREAQRPWQMVVLKPAIQARMGGKIGRERLRQALDAAVDVGVVEQVGGPRLLMWKLAGEARLLTTEEPNEVRELPEAIKAAARAAGKGYTHTLGGDR